MFCFMVYFVFFFKQKTAYEMRISDWSSDVCSSDLLAERHRPEVRESSDARIRRGGHDRPKDALRNASAVLIYEEVGGDAARPVSEPADRKHLVAFSRSEERRVGKECVSTCRSRWSPYH